MATQVFQLANIRFIKRIIVGNDSPQHPRSEAEIRQAMDLVNRCLTETPRGYIIGMEKNFSIYSIGEHQIVLQYMVYNIGFERKPMWIDDEPG